ncbi:MAG: IgGFc-binding protein [Byssovorax sp.]
MRAPRLQLASSIALILPGLVACGRPIAPAPAGDPATSSAATSGAGGAPTTSVGSWAVGVGPSTSVGVGGGSSALCLVGTIQCDGAVARICDGHGGFTDTVACGGAEPVCAPGLGCLACAPGTGSCDGEMGTFCRGDGSGFSVEVCDPVQGTSCNPGAGRCDGACGLTALGKSYIGCDYYPTVTANLTDSAVFHFAVTVSNTSKLPAAVTVTQGPATLAAVLVAPHSVEVVILPWNEALKGPSSVLLAPFPQSVAVAKGAYRLRSTQPVTVVQWNPLEYACGGALSYSNDASLLLPSTAWTGAYRVAARHHFKGSSGFYAVTAREDGTLVTVTPGPGGGLVKAGVPGIGTDGSGQTLLDAGDVIEIVTDGAEDPSDPDDVTGTLVSADKPVQVIAGHQCTYVPDEVGACDHLEESMFPLETLASKYLVSAPLAPSGDGAVEPERVRIIATRDGTTLSYDPPQPGAPASIGLAGAWVEIPDTAASFQVSANQPILVAQYLLGQELTGGGDPSLSLAVSPAQYRTSYLFHAPTSYGLNYVNITAPVGAVVALDGQPVPADSFSALGSTGFAVSRRSLSNGASGSHTAASAVPFGITVYGYGEYTSYWVPGGLNLAVLHQ